MNRENADRTMKQMLSAKFFPDSKPKVYLHTCCAPCASSSIERIAPMCELTVVFYNPNIMPRAEYERRKAELKRLIDEAYEGVRFVDLDYDNERFMAMARGKEYDPEKGRRCLLCYDMRMRRVAELAKAEGADFFATTLTLSPHKSTDDINVVGRRIEAEMGQRYLPTDFKRWSGYERSLELSRVYDLYRQSYCGCQLMTDQNAISEKEMCENAMCLQEKD